MDSNIVDRNIRLLKFSIDEVCVQFEMRSGTVL